MSSKRFTLSNTFLTLQTLRSVHGWYLDGRNFVQATGEDRYLNEAWELYYHVLRRIMAQFRSLTSLELQYVSRRLHTCRDFELAVPGSYVPHEKLIRISHIHSQLQVCFR
jgi:phosphatidylinositol kinase/protein kinase (PI-3  family)